MKEKAEMLKDYFSIDIREVLVTASDQLYSDVYIIPLLVSCV